MKKHPNATLATRLKEARTNKNVSQQQLGKIANVHYTNIGRYERGDAIPSSDVLNKTSRALEISPDFLMNGSLANKATDMLKMNACLFSLKRLKDSQKIKKAC